MTFVDPLNNSKNMSSSYEHNSPFQSNNAVTNKVAFNSVLNPSVQKAFVLLTVKTVLQNAVRRLNLFETAGESRIGEGTPQRW